MCRDLGILVCCVLIVACVVLCAASPAEDWPTYLRDNARSGVSQEKLDLPLHEGWVFESRHAPRPAWPEPAKQDFWHELRELRPTVVYDRAFHAVSVGDSVYFGSTADDKVYCLDAATGKVRWSFYTEGPVRLAPTVAGGKVYFGSDDAWVYCLTAADGALVWKYRPDEEDRRFPGNGRVISSMPSRTGVLVDNGVAYFCVGLFPTEAVYTCALDAGTGKVRWCDKTRKISPQGYLVASPTRLFVPTGRTTPTLLDRETGEHLGALGGQGGAYAVLVDDVVVSGPGLRTLGNQLDAADVTTRETVATFPGIHMVVSGDMAYLQSKDELSALNRTRYLALSRERTGLSGHVEDIKERLEELGGKDDVDGASKSAETKRLNDEMAATERSIAELTQQMAACYLWKKPLDDPYALILAGDVLFAGREGKVMAISTGDGAEIWTGQVPGRAYGLSVANGRLLVSTSAGTVHCFTPEQPEREYVVRAPEEPAPYPEDKLTALYAQAADDIVAQSGVTKGYCLVLGCGEGRLAYELAKRTDLNIVGVEKDLKKVARAREALDRAGLYGVRVTVHQWKEARLPYTSYMANLVVSDEALVAGKLDVPAAEVYRVLRPYGGCACIGQPAVTKGLRRRLSESDLEGWLDAGAVTEATVSEERGAWAVIRRGTPEGAGEWTQLYATPNHTACSMDPLRGPMAIQWFGEPGPRDMIDRHHRPMSSLFKDGRLFIPANDLVISVDPYNGTPVWELEIPNSRRVGALKNSGHMLVTHDYLYVAVEGKCWAIDVAEGTRAFTIELPDKDREPHDWGYLNCVDDQLFGAAQAVGASFTRLAKATVNMIEGDFRPVMVSQYVFSVDRHSGKKRWVYDKGAFLNDTITVDDGRIYFIESRNEKARANADGRIRIDFFLESDAYLVALDIKSGKKLWERPVDLPYQHIAYLNGAEGTLLACGTYNEGDEVYYGLFGFDMKTGQDKWHTAYRALDVRGNKFAGTGGSHGEQWQHPVIIGSTFYSRPFAFDLHTGEKKDYIAYRGGHGCGGLTGSAYYLYGRGDNPRMYPIEDDKTSGIALTRVSRPGCWLNIIPACGIIMIPESSSGCTCAFPLQTSFALIPRAVCGKAAG